MLPSRLSWLLVCREAIAAFVVVVGVAGSTLAFFAPPQLKPYKSVVVGFCDQAQERAPTGRLSNEWVVQTGRLRITRECGDGSFDWVSLQRPGRPPVRASVERDKPATAHLFDDGTTLLEDELGQRLASSSSGVLRLSDAQYQTTDRSTWTLAHAAEWLPAAALLCALLGITLHSSLTWRKEVKLRAAVDGWLEGERFIPTDQRLDACLAQTGLTPGPALAFDVVPFGGYRELHSASVSPGSRAAHRRSLVVAELKCRTAALLLVSAAVLLALLAR
jgi:hypothetical protein